MKLLFKKSLLLCLMGLVVLMLTGCEKQKDSSAELLEEARSSGKLTLVQFGVSTPSCYPCIAVKVVLDEITEEYGDKLNVILIDTEEKKN